MISCKERRDDRYIPSRFLNRWADDCPGDDADAWTFGTTDIVRPKNFDIPFSSVLENAKQLSLFVDMDNEVLGGTPRIGGTRIPIYRVLNAIDEYGSLNGVITAYRSLTIEQVHDAVQFAAHVLEYPVEHETETVD